MYNLKIISSTIRPGRKGPVIARWIEEKARKTGDFKTEILDLGEIQLPLMTEVYHPRQQKYEHEHTLRWSEKIGEADAYIFVTAEYDHNYPAPLKNALEYLAREWQYKPAGIVSYGGVSAGTRAMKSLQGDLSSKRMAPLADAVNIPFFQEQINKNGIFEPNGISEKAAEIMLKELARWAKGLKVVRENP